MKTYNYIIKVSKFDDAWHRYKLSTYYLNGTDNDLKQLIKKQKEWSLKYTLPIYHKKYPIKIKVFKRDDTYK